MERKVICVYLFLLFKSLFNNVRNFVIEINFFLKGKYSKLVD